MESTHGEKRGQKTHDINIRIPIAFREIGKGYSSIESFSKLLSSPPPMDNKCYRKTCGDLHTAYIEAAQESMLSAGLEAKPLNTEVPYYENNINIKDIRASFDGTWQRRGVFVSKRCRLVYF